MTVAAKPHATFQLLVAVAIVVIGTGCNVGYDVDSVSVIGEQQGDAGNDSTSSGAAAIGESCRNDADCETSKCSAGSDFPGGTCTTQCESSWDCPEGFSCTSVSGAGLCLQKCNQTQDCRDEYECERKSAYYSFRSVRVCFGDS